MGDAHAIVHLSHPGMLSETLDWSATPKMPSAMPTASAVGFR